MKKYILIQNDGEIESNSFELIGASTKRGETGKIGFFGSGLKYSIAYMMRNSIEFKIFSGMNELVFSTTPEILKEQSFDRICINGKQTSYTITMGPTWKEDWFVLREIYCNAMDEGNCILVRDTENINPIEGKTRIYIALTTPLTEVVNNWDKYFSYDRDPVFISKDAYTSFIGNADVGGKNHQEVSIYQKTEGVLFRKGVRVYSDDRLAYDYDFQYADINEDRTAKHPNAMGYVSVNLMANLDNESFVKTILRSGVDDKPCSEYSNMAFYEPEFNAFSTKWNEFSEENLLIVKEISGRFSEQISRTTKEVFYIPTYFARHLKKRLPNVTVLGMGKSIGAVGIQEIEKTPKMDFLLKEVLKSLKEMKYDIPYPISVGQFDDENILGSADIKEKHIYLSDRVFDMGRREIAATLMEETEHIASGKEDETRAFQTHIFSQWLKSMEESNSLFL